ncbi:hypothetical protein F4781DRAFT_435668 [Annulohypoxylon bovei var. microspora]|nr:hypothetical protein F4781DRAFT_435668 [Annulohypoxylon bovei var. microspora]
MARITEAPSTVDDMAQLQKRNEELEKEILALREMLEPLANESKELRVLLKENVADIRSARHHTARLQGEINILKKPRRTSARKRELESSQARVRELETELDNTKLQNNQLQQMGMNMQNSSEYWKQLYEASQTESQERQRKIEQLEVQNASLSMFLGPQQPVTTPPEEVQGNNMAIAYNLGGDAQVASQAQTGQLGGNMGQLPNLNNLGSYGYQQDYENPDPWQGGGYDFNLQP